MVWEVFWFVNDAGRSGTLSAVPAMDVPQMPPRDFCESIDGCDRCRR